MANEKISQMLPVVTLDDDAVVPIVQEGLNYKATILQVRGSGGGGVTAVTGTPPLNSTGGTTPDLSIDNADATHAGVVTLADQQLGAGIKYVDTLAAIPGSTVSAYLAALAPAGVFSAFQVMTAGIFTGGAITFADGNTYHVIVAYNSGGDFVLDMWDTDATVLSRCGLKFGTGTPIYWNLSAGTVYAVADHVGVSGTLTDGSVVEGGIITTIGGGGGSIAWGAITGTLSAQTDLATALDAKITDPGSHTIGSVLAIDLSANPFWTTGLQVNSSQLILNPVSGFDPFITFNRQDLTTVHIDTQAGSTWTFTLPPDAGTALQFLQTDGTGVTIWEDAPAPVWGAITGTLSDQSDLQAVLDTIIAPGGTHYAVQVNDGAGGLTGSVNVAAVGNVLQVSDGSTGVVSLSGNGGDVHLRIASLSTVAELVRFDASLLELSFFGVATVGQQAANAALTDSTGGTASTTLNAVSGTGADATINDNLASLAARLAEIRALLLAYGLGN